MRIPGSVVIFLLWNLMSTFCQQFIMQMYSEHDPSCILPPFEDGLFESWSKNPWLISEDCWQIIPLSVNFAKTASFTKSS